MAAPFSDRPAAPFFRGPGEAGATAFWAEAEDGLRLRLVHWAAGREAAGTLLLLQGRTEHAEKYGRVAGDFTARGFHLLTVDWRGQGLSDRVDTGPLATLARAALPELRRAIGHVENILDYQRDLAVLVDAARAAGLPRPWVMLAHSMGGCIGLRALHRGLGVEAAALSAPMWGLGLKGMRRAFAWGVATAARRVGQGGRFPPFVSPLSYAMETTYEENDLTSDPDEFARLQAQLAARPELALGAPSLRWLSEALRETAALRALPPPRLPALAALGSGERIIDPAPVHALMRRWEGGRLDIYENARHEVMIEAPAHKRRFVESVADLAARAGS